MSRNRFLKILIAVLFSVFSLMTLIGCNEPKIYKLHSYEYENTMYNVGDGFYGIKLTESLTTLELKDGNLKLTISKALSPYVAHEFVTYTGTYTETETEINALILDFSTNAIKITKTGTLLSLKLPNDNTLVLVQEQ